MRHEDDWDDPSNEESRAAKRYRARESLTHIQLVLLDEILMLQAQYGVDYHPSMPQLEAALNKRKHNRVQSSVFYHYRELQRKGYIDVTPSRKKKLKVLID